MSLCSTVLPRLSVPVYPAFDFRQDIIYDKK